MPTTLARLLKCHWVGLLSSAAVLLALQLGLFGGALPAGLLITAGWLFSVLRVQSSVSEQGLRLAGQQVSELTHELNSTVGETIHLAGEELQQADGLVKKAIAELDAGFSAIASHAGQQQQMLERLHEQLSRLPDEQLARSQALQDLLQALTHGNGVVHEHLGSAVRALQFEDMVHQIIEHLSSRMQDIGGLTGQLAEQAGGLGEVGSALECGERLGRLRQQIIDRRQAMQRADHRAVSQSSMDEGDIELF